MLALNRADAEREKERERERERGVLALNRADAERERQRQRGVRARWESKTLHLRGSTSDSQKLGLGAFLKGKKVTKGVCNVAKLATQHLHFSN